ncbi:MAG TPA: SAM-dependent methyltransferase [Cyclobacteriaceae bacterium]|nr:SAM-dependent methyltransferase [Cyclobacteriaceae bacterium]
MSQKGKLFLIPTVIAEDTQEQVIPASVRKELMNIHHFLAEDVRTARRFLSSLKIYDAIEPLQFNVLNKDTRANELTSLFAPIMEGKNLGVLSESGCPGVADPGALAVRFAHRNGIVVIPLVGPSSILLALMASGLNGQQFAFHGYLPIDGKDAGDAIKSLEKESRARNQTQIFIETPYRNNQVMAHLLKSLHPETLLCMAVDVTGSQESLQMHTVKEWRQKSVELPKLPAVFLFLAQ